jgi:ParB/RepB/Spo0J family partition protein
MTKSAAKPAAKPAKVAKTPPAPPADSEISTSLHAGDQPPLLGRTTLRWSEIAPDPDNPRKHFDEEALDELAVSIAQDGLLQNLLVRTAAQVDGRIVHRLVAGERRWRAIGRAIDKGLIEEPTFRIPVDVRDLTDEQAAFLSLLENMARKDLKPLEEARHFRLLIDTHGQTTATIAEKTGFTQRFVQQRLQLLELKPGDMESLDAGNINIEEARRRIAGYPKPIEISALARVVFLEVAHRIARAKGNFWTKVE